jgi:hypothetical protein
MATVFCNYTKQLFYIILIIGVLGEKGDLTGEIEIHVTAENGLCCCCVVWAGI